MGIHYPHINRVKIYRIKNYLSISTNNIAIGLVRVRKIRFRPTINTLSSAFRKLHIMPPVSQKLFVKKRYASSSFAPHICLRSEHETLGHLSFGKPSQ
jgi:hypothetical protein